MLTREGVGRRWGKLAYRHVSTFSCNDTGRKEGGQIKETPLLSAEAMTVCFVVLFGKVQG